MRILAAIGLLSLIPAAASAEPLAGISTEVVMLPSTKETDAVGDLAWQALVKRLAQTPRTYQRRGVFHIYRGILWKHHDMKRKGQVCPPLSVFLITL
ncbi:hypothetical protein [Granulibacter bethesdensis]|uniref:hypothetical protein n=1 Tax=Granulibacter bethesdensis TaxID=364410 RepID=UPI0012FE60E3|nr:hypothetical protein [Granulibacter bethesdensis]